MEKRIITTLVGVVCLLVSISAQAQFPNNGMREYRVLAVKKGDYSIVSVSNVVSVAPVMQVYVPSAFSPNKDGHNEIFRPEGDGIREYTLEVSNRWGELIYVGQEWDGTYQGNPVMPGAYVYRVTLKAASGETNYLNGTVTLVN